MNKLQKLINIFLVLIVFISLTHPIESQINSLMDVDYEINMVYPAVLISEKALNYVTKLADLDPKFKSEWIKTYHSVEIITLQNGIQKNALGLDSKLTLQQKSNLRNADKNEKIIVIIDYIPNNNLSTNDIQKMDFKINIDPMHKASFVGGEQALLQYLKDNAIDKIPQGSYKDYDLSALTFCVDKFGSITDVRIVQTNKNKEAEESILFESICDMPNWKPAEYSNGIKVKQTYALTVGNMANCTVHTLNIHKN